MGWAVALLLPSAPSPNFPPPKHYRAEITMLMSPSRVKQVSMAAFARVM